MMERNNRISPIREDPEEERAAEEVQRNIENFKGQISAWAWITFVGRLVLFLAYAVAACILFYFSVNNDACLVQSTYKQEFVVNVVSNPFFSSSSVLSGAPASKLEIQYYNATASVQRAADIGMFPNQILDVYNKAAFWPVALKPQAVTAADESIPSTRMHPGMYYFDPTTKQVLANNIPVQGGAGSAFKNMLLSYVRGRMRAGMQLPNFVRCNRRHLPDADKLYGTTAEDQAQLLDWLNHMMRFEKNSHLRGTCLLTGQQPTVDMTSNYKTSMVLFSSVNVIFMLALILWITASFSLFYIGGVPKPPEPNPGDENSWTSKVEDVFMVLGILWNVAGVVYVLVPNAQDHSNIPLNNVVIAVFALVASILVQWSWATFRMFDISTHEEAAQSVMDEAGMQASDDDVELSNGPLPIGGGGEGDKGEQQNGSGDYWDGYENNPDQQGYAASPFGVNAGNGMLQLNTSQFLATANAVKTYGIKYAKYMAYGGHGGLRQRRGMNNSRHVARAAHLGSRIASMPRYTAMVRLGTPIVMYRYIHMLKKEMHIDSVQSLEYTITTPLLSAVVVAAISPNIPTGMVQWVAVCLLVSHLLCTPILYFSHFLSKYASNETIRVYTAPVKLGIFMFLVACVGLQIIAFIIKLSYITGTWDYYSVDGIIPASVWFLFIMQMLFILTVLLVSAPSLMGYGDTSNVVKLVGEYSSTAYTFINLFIKLVVGCMLASSAVYKHFPVFSCDIWEGRYFSPNPIVMA